MMKRRIKGELVDVPEDEEARIRASVVPDGSSGPLLENHGPFDVVLSDKEAEALRAQWAEADPPVPTKIIPGDVFLERVTDDEYMAARALEAKDAQVARWLEIFRANGSVNVLGDTAQKAKAAFVKLGVLTQKRADEIFN